MAQRHLGLTLGGGGFRGSAHVGVLYELERLQITVDVVSGTSIGAIIGAAVAAGYRASEIERAFSGITPRNLISRERTGWGFVGPHKLRLLLEDLFGQRQIEQLPRPFAAIAVDLVTGHEVVLDRGPLVEALLASCAIPGLFPPQRRGAATLVDGGIRNNLPVGAAHRLGAERVIAVNLITDAIFSLDHLPSAGRLSWQRWLPSRQLALAERALLLMMHYLTAQSLAQTPPDLLLAPAVSAGSTAAFLSAAAGLAAGRAAARTQAEALLQLQQWRAGHDDSVTH